MTNEPETETEAAVTDAPDESKATKKAKPAKRDQAEINAQLRARAARQAIKVQAKPEDEETVTCRVLKNGDGRISTGNHAAGIGEVHYEKGEEFQAVLSTATELEDRGFVEIK